MSTTDDAAAPAASAQPYDYSGASQGPPGAPASSDAVTFITPGDTATTISGSNRSFVIEYTGKTNDAGGNSIDVTGSNNQFVIKYDFSPNDGGTPSGDGNNTVKIDGGNNTFVVAFDYGTSSPTAPAPAPTPPPPPTPAPPTRSRASPAGSNAARA